MHEQLKKIYRAIIKRLPTKIVLNIDNLRGYKRLLKKDRIEYFGEKIQWIKMHGNLEKYRNLVDKYKVREFVKQKIGEKYLTEILGVYKSTDEIDFDKLPKKFVLKLNTGSGYNIICTDKEKLNKRKTIKQLNKWLKEDYSKIKKEPQYKNIDKKIICEKYMEDKEENLLDYKFFCFSGKVEFIEVDFDRFKNHAMNFYDTKWKLLDLKKGKYPNYLGKLEKPINLDEMINIAEKLSCDLPFARIDLYDVDNKIYFGEITLTPAGGLTPFIPLSQDKKYAQKIDLKKYKKINVLSILRVSNKANILDGVTIKSRVLKDYINDIQEISNIVIDVDNWKKRFLNIGIQVLKNYRNCDKIVICSSSNGAYQILKFLKFINSKKEIYYFVAGGILADNIEKGKFNIAVYKNIKEIYVESDDMLQKMHKLGLNNVQKVYNFRQVQDFKNMYKIDNTTKCVFYGRVIKEKGVEEAIKVVNKLYAENFKISLDIYGQANETYLEYLKSIANPDIIKFKGAIVPDNKKEYEILSQYDIFLFPTEHPGEGLPGALIDTYIAGLAVIASNWKYAKEYIEDGKNGLIFEYKNYDDFYKKLKELIASNKIEDYKKASKELSKRFLVSNVLQSFRDELESNL